MYLQKCQLAPIFGPTQTPEVQLTYFPMVRALPGLSDGHRNCPKGPFLANVMIRGFKVLTRKGTSEPLFMKLRHYFGFHFFCFHCQILTDFF